MYFYWVLVQKSNSNSISICVQFCSCVMHRIVNNTIQLSTLFDEDPDQAMALNGSETRSSCNVFNFPDLTMLNNQTKTLKISGFIYRVSHFRPRTLEVDFLDGFLNAHNTHRSSVSSISVTEKSPLLQGFEEVKDRKLSS